MNYQDRKKAYEAELVELKNKYRINDDDQEYSGVVHWFNGEKGYGFITADNGDDIFVHFTEIQGEGFKILHEGDKVVFRIHHGNRGATAKNIKKVN